MRIKTTDVLALVMALVAAMAMVIMTVNAIDAEVKISEEKVKNHLAVWDRLP